MPDDVPPMSDDDTVVPPDPFEAELVAYLDGELEPAAARRVEDRLAADPEARAKAAALKKTFDLLDFLPKPEPSPTFATRTLDRLPAVRSGAQAPPAPAAALAAGTPSTSSPVVLQTGSLPLPPEPPPLRRGLWAAGLLVAAAACAGAGYLASNATRTHLLPAAQRDTQADALPVSDHRVVENLHLYAAADDIAFVRELASPEFFGDDPAVSGDPALRPPPAEPDKPPGEAFEQLAAAFRALPPSRRLAVRELDRQLHAEEPAARDRLFRVMELYAIWLDDLPDDERRKVYSADTARRRLDEVRQLRNEQWLDARPPAQRAELRRLLPDERAARILRWREREAEARDDWAFFRSRTPEIAANRPPWPFDTEEGTRGVTDFARRAFHTDEPKKSRLTPFEFNRLETTLALARDRDGWLWYPYGRAVYDIYRRYEERLLPEPADGEPVTTYAQLGKAENRFEKGKGRAATFPHLGKWPDFALAVHNFAVVEKGDKFALPPLGPARPREFKEPLRTFVTKELPRELTLEEQKGLEALLGKWPDYPREVVRLAKLHDLAAPGLMPPGSPNRWEAMYGTPPRPRP